MMDGGESGGARAAASAGTDISLSLQFCGLKFNTPLVLLSGCAGFGREYARVQGFSHDEVGAVCLKGTTLEPRLGNSGHRLAETPAGMLNSIGLQNPGVREVVEKHLPLLDYGETHFIANVSGSTVAEYAEVTRFFDDSPVAAIEINVSCPNVAAGGLSFGNDPEICARVVAACRRRTGKPLITKMSPNQTDIAGNARRCIEAGTDAFSVINTITGMAIDIERRRPVLGSGQGGLSGPAIKPAALYRVFQVCRVCRPHGVPVIGQGGVAGGTDAVEFMLAGASAVGVGTALSYDPLVCREINRTLRAYLARQGMSRISELIGALRDAEGVATDG